MKKLKINLVMIAAILGIAGAIATKAVANTHKAKDPIYNWVLFDEMGNQIGTATNTVADEEAVTGCTGSGAKCATGTANDEPPVTLKYVD